MNARHIRNVFVASIVAGTLVASGCRKNNHNPIVANPDMAGLIVGTLMIDPTEAVMEVACSGGDIPQQLKAKLVQQGQLIEDAQDVTGSAMWQVDDKDLVTVTKGLVKPTCSQFMHGGRVNISAVERGFANASVTIHYKAKDVFALGAPDNANAAFDGPLTGDPNEIPQILYPLDGAMHAVNIGQITFQWYGYEREQLYRIKATGENVEAAFYVGTQACTPGGDPKYPGRMQCAFQPKADQWRSVAESAKGGQISIALTSTSGFGQPIGEAIPVSAQFSPEYVRGGFYYFSPTMDGGGLKRTPFGSTIANDFVKGGMNTQFKCIGCHAISSDGKKVAATFYGGDGTGGMVDATDGNKFLIRPEASAGGAVRRWNFATFSPDGSLLLTNWAGVLTLRDGNSGNKKFDVPANVICPNMAECTGKAIMPDWSPDGSSVAFVQVPIDGKIGREFQNSNLNAGDWDCGNVGNIAVMKYMEGKFTDAVTVVPSVPHTEYHYFPSWSPPASENTASKWILFVTSKYPGSSPSAATNLFGNIGATFPKDYVANYDQDTARLRMVAAEGGLPIELTNAVHEVDRTTSWPRFAPFVQNTATQQIAFFTFSAKFNYGWKVTDGKTPQLWMSAVDLRAAEMFQGSDPSYTPFWLPFQRTDEKNHSGIWTREISCTRPEDCGDQYACQGMVCVPTTGTK